MESRRKFIIGYGRMFDEAYSSSWWQPNIDLIEFDGFKHRFDIDPASRTMSSAEENCIKRVVEAFSWNNAGHRFERHLRYYTAIHELVAAASI
jgi:hypothetical protein